MRHLKLRVQALFSLLFAAAGFWLVIAPIVIGFQPRGATWVTASLNDVIAGAVLILVSLVILAVQLVTTTRSRLPD